MGCYYSLFSLVNENNNQVKVLEDYINNLNHIKAKMTKTNNDAIEAVKIMKGYLSISKISQLETQIKDYTEQIDSIDILISNYISELEKIKPKTD